MNPYEIAPAAGGSVLLHCPVCSATYPVAPFTETACPNADQDDHAPTSSGRARRRVRHGKGARR